MKLEIIRTKTQTIVECAINYKAGRKQTPGWGPDNVYPFFPETLFVPKNITRATINALRPGYKADALNEAKERVAALKQRGRVAKIVPRSAGYYEVLVKERK